MSNKIAKPVITIPLRVNQRAIKRQEKIRMKELEAKHSKYYKGDRTLPPLIKCRRSELDHFKGQIYPSFKKLPMATEHWMSRSTIGDFFAFIPFRGGNILICMYQGGCTRWHGGGGSRMKQNSCKVAGRKCKNLSDTKAKMKHVQPPGMYTYYVYHFLHSCKINSSTFYTDGEIR